MAEHRAAALAHAVNLALLDVHAQVEGGVADDFGHGDDAVAAYAAKYDVFFHCCCPFLFIGCNTFFVLDDADALRDDDADAVVGDLLFENLHELVVVLGQRHDGADVVGVDAEALADVEELLVGARGLTAGHSRDVVVENHDDDVGLLVDAVEQTGHAAVAEGAVADDADGGEDAHLGSALGHGDAGAHADGGVDGTHVEAEGVASDVTEDAAVGVFLHHVDHSLERTFISSITKL